MPAAAALLLVLFAFAAIELCARAVSYLWLNYSPDSRAGADAYRSADATWVADYYREFRESGVSEWRPYVLWRRVPYSGRYINVDQRGVRRSWSTPAASATVWVFGGSTAWGTGARDEHTAPSEVAKALAAAGHPSAAVNFGESGYVMRQGLEALITELQVGHRPQAVVFQSGVEDTFAVFQGAAPGEPQNQENRRAEFNVGQPEAFSQQLGFIASGSRFVANALRGLLVRPASAPAFAPVEIQASALASHACAVATTLQALGGAYGFEPIVVLQPMLFSKRQKTAYERMAAAEYQAVAPLFDAFYQQMRSHPCATTSTIDASRIADDETAPLFVDAFHLSEEGNRRLASAIAPAIVAALENRAREHR